MGWPTTTEEEWRRTDVSRLGMEGFAPARSGTRCLPAGSGRGQAGRAGVIRFEAGHARKSACPKSCRRKACGSCRWTSRLKSSRPRCTLFIGGTGGSGQSFHGMALRGWSHGAFLWVPPGLEIKEPFLIDFTERGPGILSSPHVSVILGEGAHATVVQNITGVGPDAASRILCNAAIDLRLADAAALQYCEVQELGEQSLYFRHARADVGRDASLRHLDAAFGSRVVKSRMECAMSGRGSEAFLDGVYYCRKGQQMDIRTVQLHRSPQATSRAYYKGAVAGGGRTVFQGLIDVSTGASGTDAYLTNRNLILGDAARSDSIPTLKIGNNDVKCSHGSTTGRLSAEELFYLESRGYAEADAREMLVVGYFEDLLTKAPESSARVRSPPSVRGSAVPPEGGTQRTEDPGSGSGSPLRLTW